jgi:uncharacterized protein YukE
MARVFADPESIEVFVTQLRACLSNIDENVHALQGQYAGLQDTWQDQECQKFTEQFNDLVRILIQYNEQVESEHIPYLLKKAEILREYQNS